MGVGLINSWGVIWVSTILIYNDAQTDFMRIERTTGVFGTDTGNRVNGSRSPKETDIQKKILEDVTNGSSGPRHRHGEFAWQPYPLAPFIERLDWVLDIFCNFRGMGWNWRISALPPPPKYIQTQLHRNSGTLVPRHSFKTHSSQVKQYTTRKELLQNNAWTLLKGYLALDTLKTCMMHDPYFWGYVHDPLPPYYPSLLTHSPVLTHMYRLLLSMFGIKYALETIFCLAPLFFSGLLSPSLLGARAEPWMYPETWASYSVVLDHGLAGWWGNWWHQTFRFAFQEPTRKLRESFGIPRHSPLAEALQLGVAFFLSGVIHASGSYTSAGSASTQPLRGSMAFFLLQAVAIFIEAATSRLARGLGIDRRVPGWAKRLFALVYVHVWFYHTAHLLCNDFARAGVWLFEPVPFSPLRGLGLGPDARDGWWCWSEQLPGWHQGDRWWRSGLALTREIVQQKIDYIEAHRIISLVEA
ncbi:hypothetical protein yc1106_05821 [Curvularia clavata]|uniref:Wax synthase domain-containing protein n=1 Tax=Curvularia clavata TaxID=95742 RepID=A0A9Q9DT94_CURCL|nr:hypothetical protein yc1106_05821 [Curvularia clavata]